MIDKKGRTNFGKEQLGLKNIMEIKVVFFCKMFQIIDQYIIDLTSQISRQNLRSLMRKKALVLLRGPNFKTHYNLKKASEKWKQIFSHVELS